MKKLHLVIYHHLKNMRLRISVLARSSSVCIILTYVIGVSSRDYTQDEIDPAAHKMLKREEYFLIFKDQYGCWPKNVIPYIIHPGFSK
jgi:hypothetical protein